MELDITPVEDAERRYPPIPAATVVVLRDGETGLETLMVRRNSKLAFAGGMWVWPGGRIDDVDRTDLEADDDEGAARRAAVREAREEAGVDLDELGLVWFSHWTPPPIGPRRFSTWFFATTTAVGDITIDGGEIHDHAWMAPADALARRNALEIELAPPTWITLEHLRHYTSAAGALADLASRPAERFATRFATLEEGAVALYHGDAGYEMSDAAIEGPRHRLWMLPEGWRYERDGFVDSQAP